MVSAARSTGFLDADTFLPRNHLAFGDARRYELVGNTIVARAAPSPEHGHIPGNLTTEIKHPNA